VIEQDLGVRLVLRMAALQRSSHRAAVVGLLGAFPDARLLTAGTQLATGEALATLLVDRTEALLIATTDPTGLERTATALYALHGPDLDLLERLRARRIPPWDSRELFEPTPGLLAFARPDLQGPGTARPPAPGLPAGAPAPSEPPAAASAAPGAALDRTWPQRLRALLSRPGPALSLEVYNLNQRLLLRHLPTPVRIAAALTAAPDPELRIRAELRSADEAEALRVALEKLRERLLGDFRYTLLGLSELLKDIKLTVQGHTVEITGTAPGRSVDALLGLAALSLSSLPSGDPAPPPPIMPIVPDLGPVDQGPAPDL
jgi:hypothetical protein